MRLLLVSPHEGQAQVRVIRIGILATVGTLECVLAVHVGFSEVQGAFFNSDPFTSSCRGNQFLICR